MADPTSEVPTTSDSSSSVSSSSSSSSSASPTTPSTSAPPPPSSSSSASPSTSSRSSVTPSSTVSEDPEPSTDTDPTTPTVTEPDETLTSTSRSPIITDPATVTQTSTVTSNRPSVSATSIADAKPENGFFQNTGAVAGVFSVVGLIVLALLIALVTTGIRRRRAKKFDREIEAAAREAAAAQPPVGFLDDDDEDRYNRGYSNGSGGGGVGAAAAYGGGYGAYSDVSSHGTYNQPAMSHTGSGGAPESYNMREIDSNTTRSGGHMSISPGEVFDYTAAAGGAAGAAGIGVARARSMKGANANYGQALQDGSTPYAAFSAPPMPSTSPGPNGSRRNTGGYDSSRGMDILEAAGMGAHLTGAGLARGGSQYQQGLERNKSLTSSSQYSNGSGGSSSQQPYYGGGGSGDYPPMPQPQQQGGYTDYPAYNQGRQAAIAEDDGDDDAYGGYVVDEPSAVALGKQREVQRDSVGGAPMPNPFDASAMMQREQQRQQMQGGYPETPDVNEGPRVLKVANE